MKTRIRIAILAFAICTFGGSLSSYADEKGAFNENQICKAGIAKIMGRNPAIIKIDQIKGHTIFLSYIRQDDRTKWKYKCKIEGSLIIWGADNGRWRTHSLDSKVSFKVSESSITITDTFSDGSSSQESYALGQVGN